jgi:ribosomal protein S18 acetylase RimI-like enzyme
MRDNAEVITTRPAGLSDLAAAAAVWEQANVARDKAPGTERIARVKAKLADPGAVVIVAEEGSEVVGMALAEPGLADDGVGSSLPELCHISMVFVHPGHWGKAIGAELLTAIAAAAEERGHSTLQLWTGQNNERAQRLYRRCGFSPTGRTKQLDTGELVLHLARPVGA